MPFAESELLSMRSTTPPKLIATPPTFLSVRGSFKKNVAKNIVKIGVSDANIEASSGVVWFRAVRKLICVRNSPSIEARKIFGKSFLSIGSLGRKSETSQKQTVAPMARIQKSPIEEIMWADTRFLQEIILNPNMT
jgi:hypothetical protein